MGVLTLAGVIGSVGFASGDRVVVGHWWSSPLGAFTDVMWATPDGVRVLYAPDERVGRFVTSLYRFERTEVVPFRTEGDARRFAVQFGDRTLEWRSRFVFPIPFGRPRWFTRWVEGPIARSVLGVRTYGVTPTGVQEWYQAEVYRTVREAEATVDGRSLGAWGRPTPALDVGFSEPPRRASVVNLRTRLLDPSGRLDAVVGSPHPAGRADPHSDRRADAFGSGGPVRYTTPKRTAAERGETP
jgi:hypothetical protein